MPCQCLKCSSINVVNGTVRSTKGHVVGGEEESREEEEQRGGGSGEECD